MFASNEPLEKKLENLAGYIAWMIICFVTVKSLSVNFGKSSPQVLWAILLLLGFIIGFYFSIREIRYHHFDKFKRIVALLVQFFFVMALYVVVQASFIAFLGALVVAQLPFRVNGINGFIGTLIVSCSHLVLLWFEQTSFNPLMQLALFTAINLFVYSMASRVYRERKSNYKISQLNQDLMMTQNLLQESATQGERLRISRDLHDLLGHHLTALILNLQYLTHTTEGENNKKVQQSHDLAKLLLSDVRETVSHIRADSQINVRMSIEKIVASIPNIPITFDCDRTFLVSEAPIAETLIRITQEALTNCLKHSSASHIELRLQKLPSQIALQIHDNGGLTRVSSQGIVEGNGLKGMRERVEKHSGSLH